MTKRLQLAEGLSLPVEAVTQAIGIIAKRRVGKSYTARRFAEQLVKAGQQIVVVDPKGDWWGMRSAADGKSPGLPVVILGGERGDVPLESGSGEIVAKLAAEERVSMILDLSLFRKHEVATFMTSFLETLYRLKAREEFRTPLMLIVDEADAIMPQKPQPNEARMLGAGEDIVRRGGQRGLGCMFITQRSAVLNKNVLTQAEMIIALRTIAPQDLKALDAWIEVHGERQQREVLMASLPALPIGDAWFWSPGWPTADGIFKRAHVFPIETFDSGATPKAGEKRIEPKNLADVDLGALTKQMAATIEKAKADDPKLLRKQLAERDSRIRQLEKGVATKTVEKPVVDQVAIDRAVARAVANARKEADTTIEKLRRALEAAMKFIVNVSTANFDAAGVDKAELEKAIAAAVDRATKMIDERLSARAAAVRKLRADAERLIDGLGKVIAQPREVTVDVAVTKNEPYSVAAAAPSRSRVSRQAVASSGGDLKGAKLKIIRGLAELEAIGVAQARREQLGFYAGMSFAGGYGSNTLGAMRTEGLIDYPAGGFVALTDAGRAAAGDVDAPASLEDLHDRIRQHLSGLEVKIFDAVVALGKDGSITRDELGEKIGASFAGGYGSNTLGALRTAGIVEYPTKGSVGPNPLLFPEGLS